MLTILLRRLALTGVLMAGLVATGLVIGEPAISGERPGKAAETVTNVVESDEFGETAVAPRQTRSASRASEMRWMFFSFGKKRSGGSW
jgi:hypothetical protein